jgi:protein TonB
MSKESLHSPIGQALAIAGTIAFHTGIAAWAMQPTPPIAIPQQQVIQVAMIAAPEPKQEIVEPTLEPAPVITPKPQGMIKIQPKLKKVEIKKPEKKEQEKPKEQAVTMPTSGPQAKEADTAQAATSQPLFDAVYLRNPPPAYPPSARRQGTEGKVLLRVEVTKEGQAQTVAVAHSSGSGILDEAAREAVQNWRFVPARRGSETVDASVIVPIIFRIREGT